MEVVHPNCAGLDVHKETVVACSRRMAAARVTREVRYLDFVALAEHMGTDAVAVALRPFDALYPQPNGESALQQLQIQLGNPMPYDLEDTNLAEYKNLAVRWHDWNAVKAVAAQCATTIFDRITGAGDDPAATPPQPQARSRPPDGSKP